MRSRHLPARTAGAHPRSVLGAPGWIIPHGEAHESASLPGAQPASATAVLVSRGVFWRELMTIEAMRKA